MLCQLTNCQMVLPSPIFVYNSGYRQKCSEIELRLVLFNLVSEKSLSTE